ncbi:serine/threonine-protein kinase [Streptomyces sp. JB150]|uniref:serine/threonine-protein kinase n=1 Tax=Streptomyces sp. JB150 TaxID=2714844 RepID=UPI0019D29EB6|nr:serine/threonine-protein kinase [Streptomyces sp. JB150]
MKVRSWPIRPDYRLTAQVVAGRYRLDDLLGRGGAADVYEGMDLRLRRPVAVKVFRPDGAADTEERFDSEGRLLAQLQHPGLITVYDCGRDDGTPFLVMELVRGTTLRRRIAAAPLTPVEACRIGAALASALAHVHRAGVVHRDVKPANILLDEAGAPRLTDFGISRLLDTTSQTAPGALVGTAAYMAPEQVLGRGAGPAADIYSLGLVLIESVKGELEYDGAPLEAAIARLHRPPVIPPDTPQALADLLRAMTDADEGRRPDAHACERALAALASGETAEASGVPAGSAVPGPPAASGESGESGEVDADGRNLDTLRSHETGAKPLGAPPLGAGAEGAVPASGGPEPARSPSGRPGARRSGRVLLTAGAALTVLGVGLAGSVGGPPTEAENAASGPPRSATTEPAAPPAERSGTSASSSPSASASPTASASGAAAVSASTRRSPSHTTGSRQVTGAEDTAAEDAAADSGVPSADGNREPQRGRASGSGAAGPADPAAEKAQARQGKPKHAKGKHAR